VAHPATERGSRHFFGLTAVEDFVPFNAGPPAVRKEKQQLLFLLPLFPPTEQNGVLLLF